MNTMRKLQKESEKQKNKEGCEAAKKVEKF